MNGVPPGMQGGGGNDQDSYAAAGLYSGPRTTGMGKQPSTDSNGTSNGAMAPISPQEPQRKRLRRGGPSGDEVSSPLLRLRGSRAHGRSPSHVTSEHC